MTPHTEEEAQSIILKSVTDHLVCSVSKFLANLVIWYIISQSHGRMNKKWPKLD
jgi:hypothetical protein